MKNILIPTDFSSNADHAIAYALNIFKCERTNFHFVHAYADEVYGPYHNVDKDTFDKQKKMIADKSENKLQKLVAKSENLNIIGSFVALEVALPKNKFKYMTVTFKRGSKT